VRVEQIDRIHPEPFERALGNRLDVPWSAVQSHRLSGFRIEFEPELRGDYYVVVKRGEGFA
jgi:hypothetical protein